MTDYKMTDEQLDELARQRLGKTLLIGIFSFAALFVVVGAAVSTLAH
jgi:hypothetical protein